MKSARDRTDDVYGAVTVIGRAGAGWRILWKCCSTEEPVTAKRVSDLEGNPPIRCRNCYNKGASQTAAAERLRRFRKKQAIEAEVAPLVIVAGNHLWPELGKMGHRYG